MAGSARRIITSCLVLTFLLRASHAAIPHVTECNFCMDCHVGNDPPVDSTAVVAPAEDEARWRRTLSAQVGRQVLQHRHDLAAAASASDPSAPAADAAAQRSSADATPSAASEDSVYASSYLRAAAASPPPPLRTDTTAGGAAAAAADQNSSSPAATAASGSSSLQADDGTGALPVYAAPRAPCDAEDPLIGYQTLEIYNPSDDDGVKDQDFSAAEEEEEEEEEDALAAVVGGRGADPALGEARAPARLPGILQRSQRRKLAGAAAAATGAAEAAVVEDGPAPTMAAVSRDMAGAYDDAAPRRGGAVNAAGVPRRKRKRRPRVLPLPVVREEEAEATVEVVVAESPPPPPVKSKYRARTKPLLPPEDPSLPLELRASSYLATFADKVPKYSLPNCTQCYGCNTKLVAMASQTTFLDRTYINEKGATSSWLFHAQTNRTASGNAVVKVYCVPLPKLKGGRVTLCTPATILRTVKLLLGIQRLAEQCGIDDILPRMWADKVDAIIPDIGYHIRWHGLWMEYAPGVSLENYLNKGSPTRFSPREVIDMMENKLNSTRVVLGSIFDLLTSQCDRHAQNIFIDPTGNLMFIDNEAAMQNSWRNCAVDSILVPTTQKQEIIRLSNAVVLKLITPEMGPKEVADPQLLLDYRCYIGRKAMGTQYPPRVAQCLKDIKAMSVAQVQKHFHLPSDLTAFNLHSRATDMITRGYEATVHGGQPQNAGPKRYRMQPKCCKLGYRGGRYRCAHPWQPSRTLPVGDPITGRDWTKPRPDSGTYQGGTITDYAEEEEEPETVEVPEVVEEDKADD